MSCEKKDDLIEYISGCNFFCQGIKAQAFENVKSSEEASETFYTIMRQLSDIFTTYKETQMGNDPEAVKTAFLTQIDAKTDLTDDEKNALKTKVASTLDSKTDFDDISYNDIQSSLKAEIVSATSAATIKQQEPPRKTVSKKCTQQLKRKLFIAFKFEL